jgi:GDP-L-fucose synthase
MRILVTGGAGFLGTSVVRRLRSDGHDVFVPRSSEYDLRSAAAVTQVFVDSLPDVVVHLAAAVGGIGANEAHPGRFLHDNAIMGLQLMERARLAGIKKFVTIGTACEYPEDADLPLRESDIWLGYPAKVTAPYGIAKRLLLAQGQAYRDEYGFNGIHLIPTNLYGPGDNFDPETSHVIPALIRRFSEATRQEFEGVRCWGTGRASREFLYVEDAADAIARATYLYDDPEPVNIGTGEEQPIAAVAEQIAELYGYAGDIWWDRSEPDGVARRWMDVSRAAEAFGFRASTPLALGLAKTIEWFET